jgi:hypothetical protein
MEEKSNKQETIGNKSFSEFSRAAKRMGYQKIEIHFLFG